MAPQWPTGALLLTSFLGFSALYLVGSQNGMTSSIIDNIKSPRHLVPNTNIPLRTRWTGFEPIDLNFSLMVTVFATVTDDRYISLFLQGNHFFAQFMCAWMLVLMEVHRGTGKHVSKWYALWGLGTEFIAVGVALPAWCAMDIANLVSLPAAVLGAPDTFKVSSPDLELLPWSMIIGIGIPTLAMGATTAGPYMPNDIGQFAILVRLFHPVFVFVIQNLLRNSSESTAQATRKRSAEDQKKRASLMNKLYGTAFWVGAAPHILVSSAIVFSYIFPNALPANITDSLKVSSLWPVATIIPSVTKKVSSIKEGVAIFMTGNEIFSAIGMVVWAWYHHSLAKSLRPSKPAHSLLSIAGMLLAFGPGATAVSLIKERDELLGVDSEDSKFNKSV